MLNTIGINAPNEEIQVSLACAALTESMERHLCEDRPFKVLVLADAIDDFKETINGYFEPNECELFTGSVFTSEVADVPINSVFDVVITVGTKHQALLERGIPPRLLVADGGEHIRVTVIGECQRLDNANYGNGTPLNETELANKTPIYVHSIHHIPTRHPEGRHARVRLYTSDGRQRIHVALRQPFDSPEAMERYLRADIFNRDAGYVLTEFDPSFYYTAMYLMDQHSLLTTEICSAHDLVGRVLPQNVRSKYNIESYVPKGKKLKTEIEQVVIDSIYRTIERSGARKFDIKQRARVRATEALHEMNVHLSPGDFELIWNVVNKAIAV